MQPEAVTQTGVDVALAIPALRQALFLAFGIPFLFALAATAWERRRGVRGLWGIALLAALGLAAAVALRVESLRPGELGFAGGPWGYAGWLGAALGLVFLTQVLVVRKLGGNRVRAAVQVLVASVAGTLMVPATLVLGVAFEWLKATLES